MAKILSVAFLEVEKNRLFSYQKSVLLMSDVIVEYNLTKRCLVACNTLIENTEITEMLHSVSSLELRCWVAMLNELQIQ